MDSHGSSLTNSSKQDDEDYDDYAENTLDVNGTVAKSSSMDNELGSAKPIVVNSTTTAMVNSKPKKFNNYNTFGSINPSSSSGAVYGNELQSTIEELGEKHARETSQLLGKEPSASATSTLSNKYKAKEATSSIYASTSTSTSAYASNSNNAPFHQKYAFLKFTLLYLINN